MPVSWDGGAKAKIETQPVSGTNLMQHRIGVARLPECLKQLKEGAVIAPPAATLPILKKQPFAPATKLEGLYPSTLGGAEMCN